jgi:hypothetical protein
VESTTTGNLKGTKIEIKYNLIHILKKNLQKCAKVIFQILTAGARVCGACCGRITEDATAGACCTTGFGGSA